MQSSLLSVKEAIFFVILVGHAACQPGTSASESSGSSSSDPHFFHEPRYLIGYLVCWNLLFEISLVVVLHFKQHNFHIVEHGTLNFVVVGGQLLNNLSLLLAHNWRNAFMLTEALVLLLILLQTAIGLYLNKKLLSSELRPGIFVARFFHRSLGKALYLLTKFQICRYMYYFYRGTGIQPVFPIGLVLGLTLATHLSIAAVLTRAPTTLVDTGTFLVDEAANPQPYRDLLRNIEAGDIVLEEDDFVLTTRLSEHAGSLEEELAPQIDWVMIEDKVFDITNARHPKGNYIMKAIRARDITRQIYGTKEWRFSNDATGYHATSQHAHHSRTFEFLRNKCIGEIPLNPLIVSADDSGRMTVKSSATINLYGASERAIRERKELLKGWQTQYVHPLDEKGTKRLIFATRKGGEALVNVSSYWLKNFGKYFLVRRSDNALGFMYVTLSLSPRYLAAKRAWLSQLRASASVESVRSFEKLYDELLTVENILRGSLPSPIQARLDQGDDIRDAFLPFLEVSKSENTDYPSGTHYSVQGPLGTGLGFNGSTTKRILIAVHDQGIAPLLDFFEFLSQRALVELNAGQPPHPIFGSEYLLTYSNAPEFFVYWEISDTFEDTADLLGLWTLRLIGRLQAGVQSGEFGDRQSAALGLLKRITVVKSRSEPQRGSLVFSTMKGYDFKTIKDLASNQSFGRIEMAVVSGDRGFVDRVLRDTDLRATQVQVL